MGKYSSDSDVEYVPTKGKQDKTESSSRENYKYRQKRHNRSRSRNRLRSHYRNSRSHSSSVGRIKRRRRNNSSSIERSPLKSYKSRRSVSKAKYSSISPIRKSSHYKYSRSPTSRKRTGGEREKRSGKSFSRKRSVSRTRSKRNSRSRSTSGNKSTNRTHEKRSSICSLSEDTSSSSSSGSSTNDSTNTPSDKEELDNKQTHLKSHVQSVHLEIKNPESSTEITSSPTIKTNVPDKTPVIDLAGDMEYNKCIIDNINNQGFTQKSFISSKSKNDEKLMNEINNTTSKHIENNLSTTIEITSNTGIASFEKSSLKNNTIFHDNVVLEDEGEKLKKWVKKLYTIRQRFLIGISKRQIFKIKKFQNNTVGRRYYNVFRIRLNGGWYAIQNIKIICLDHRLMLIDHRYLFRAVLIILSPLKSVSLMSRNSFSRPIK